MVDARDEQVFAMVKQIGAVPNAYRELVGLGTVNYVFIVDTSEGEWVVRFHRDPLDTNSYEQEEWCLRTMRDAEIPVPEFISQGSLDETRFCVTRFVAGVQADNHRSPDLWKTLGRYCRIISEVPLDTAPDSLFPRFGRDLRRNWQMHIDYNLEELTPGDPLLEFGAYPLSQQPLLRERFYWLRDRFGKFGLTHQDLVPKNALITPEGVVVLLDWENAGTGPFPLADYNRIYRDAAGEGFDAKDLAHFAEGCEVDVASMQEAMDASWLLDQIDVVRWAIDNRPDKVSEYARKARLATDVLL